MESVDSVNGEMDYQNELKKLSMELKAQLAVEEISLAYIEKK